MSNFSTSHRTSPQTQTRTRTHEYPVCIPVRKMFWLPGWEIPKKGYPISPHIIISFHQCVVFSSVLLFLLRAVFISILPNFPSVSYITHSFLRRCVCSYVLTFVKSESLASVQFQYVCVRVCCCFSSYKSQMHTERVSKIHIVSVTYIYSKDDNLLNHTFIVECYQLILKLA